jgi:hypothetical protein
MRYLALLNYWASDRAFRLRLLWRKILGDANFAGLPALYSRSISPALVSATTKAGGAACAASAIADSSANTLALFTGGAFLGRLMDEAS